MAKDNAKLWTRREFLVVSAGATGSLILAACSPGADPTTTIISTTPAPAPTTTTTTQPPLVIADYWDLLREAQSRVRTSPDNLAHHLPRLARNGDLAALTEFVRDHIAVIPNDPGAWVSNNDGRRWGTRGVLRSGMGTPREVADLIADHLNEAGIDATVVRGSINGSERPLLVPVDPPPHEIEGSLDDLFAASGSTPTPNERFADPALATAMADAALVALDPASFRGSFTNDLSGNLPDVRVGDDVAGLWHESVGLYAAEVGNTEMAPARDTVEAKFTLSIATDLNTRNPVEVASANFRLEDLAGRRVNAAFIPPAESLADLMTTRPIDVTTVIPTLSVAGLDMTDDERAALTVAGDPFMIEGSVLTEDDEGLTSTPSASPGVGDPAVGRIGGSANLSAAAEIRIRRIIAAHYPRLTVEVDVVDAGGETIKGIGADRFLVTDEGFEVPINLRRTQRPAPNVVFIVDNSTSVPEQWRNQGAVRVVTEIATAIKAGHPTARFRIANVGLSGAGLLGWTDDPQTVGQQADQFGIGSALWDSYVDAAVPEANAIVFLTDGVSVTESEDNIENEPPEDLIPQLLAGPPAIMLGSGELGGAFQGIADITGGIALPIDDQDAGIAAVLAQLDTMLQPYDMLVLADEANSATVRTLRVSLPGAGLAATATYEVPESPTLGRALAGLYLRVDANGAVVDRTLAGLPRGSNQPVTPEIAQEVRQALFGTYSVITEAGAPSPSQIVDDAITELLTWEAVATAPDAATALEAYAAAEDLPHGSFTFAVPVSGSDDTLTWETGLRMWLSSERTIPAGEVDILRRNVDLLPVSRFVTTTVEDQAEAARITAHRTATLAAFEAALYDSTSAGALTGELTELNLASVEPEDREAFAAISNGWPGSWRLAFNEGLDSAVAADPRSGGLIAVLPDGTGGGITEEEIKQAFKQAIALAELGGKAGFKAWAELEKAKLKKLRFATLVIHRMSIEGILETIEEEICSKLKKEATAWATSVVGATDAEFESLIKFYIEKAKDGKRLGDAAGLFPAIPTDLPVC